MDSIHARLRATVVPLMTRALVAERGTSMRLTCVGVRVPASRIVMAALSAALISGCHGLGGSSAASGSVTVAVIPGIDNAPLSVAAQEGIFKQHGLDVTVKQYQSLTDEYQALSSGQAQVAVGDYTGFLYQQATGAKLRLLADGYDSTSNSVAILTLPGSTITTPQELGGKTVATPSAQLVKYNATLPYNYESLTAEAVLQSDGVSPSSVGWTQADPGQEISDLKNGTVQAILVTEPYILQAEEQLGAVEVLDASSGVTDQLPMSGYFSLDSYAKANASTVQAFQTALSQAQAQCAQRGPVQSILAKLTGMNGDGDAANLVTLGTYPTSINVGQVQRVAKLMLDSGMISSPLSVSKLISG
jgi:NitT/TauT family transport system substrate-binding protein